MDKAGNCVYNTFHTADHSSAVFYRTCFTGLLYQEIRGILIVSYFYSGCGSQRYFHPKRLNESYRTGGIGCIRKIL